MRTLLAFWNHLKKSTNWIHSIPGVSNPPSTLIKKRGGHLGGYCCFLKDWEMDRAELTVQVITVPHLRPDPTHTCGITWELIPLHLFPCPQIDRCQQPLPVTRIPERGANNRDPLRTGKIGRASCRE